MFQLQIFINLNPQKKIIKHNLVTGIKQKVFLAAGLMVRCDSNRMAAVYSAQVILIDFHIYKS